MKDDPDARGSTIGAAAPAPRAGKARILVLFPTGWDRKRLVERRFAGECELELELVGPDAEEVPYDFDILGHLEAVTAREAGRVAGVTSSSDYPGATAAAAVATALGLPGSSPAAVLGCSHKHASRVVQRAVVPEAVPRFDLVDAHDAAPAAQRLDYPRFVKPVKGAFSVHSRRVDSAAELVGFLASDAVREFTDEGMKVFDRLLDRFTGIRETGRFFLAEELLRGRLVTVEGWVRAGRVELMGIVDSVTHPATGSFLAFEYPSRLPRAVQARMEAVVRRLIPALGLEHTLFNVEMIYDGVTGRLGIIEVNPRMCGQFADLYEKVDGVDGYEVAIALARGAEPPVSRRRGRHAIAGSYPLRVFEPVEAVAAPSPAAIAAAEAASAGDLLVWNEVETGWKLADFDRFEDGASVRYAVLNVGGATRRETRARVAAAVEGLGWRFAPLARPALPGRGCC